MSTSPTYWTKRYAASYRRYQERTYPATVQSFGHILPNYPAVTKSNGLTQAILNYIKWEGWRGTRVNTVGRSIITKHQGRVVGHKYIPTTTRRGTADISLTIRGRSAMIEIKCGGDQPSEYQLAEQARERAAGGVYEFIHTMDEFFGWYDGFLLSLK